MKCVLPTRCELEALWRGDPAFIGPVAPPMILWLKRGGRFDEAFINHPATAEDCAAGIVLDLPAPAIGEQMELAL